MCVWRLPFPSGFSHRRDIQLAYSWARDFASDNKSPGYLASISDLCLHLRGAGIGIFSNLLCLLTAINKTPELAVARLIAFRPDVFILHVDRVHYYVKTAVLCGTETFVRPRTYAECSSIPRWNTSQPLVAVLWAIRLRAPYPYMLLDPNLDTYRAIEDAELAAAIKDIEDAYAKAKLPVPNNDMRPTQGIEEDEEQDDLQIEEEEGAETDPTPQDDEISASGSESEATLTPPESSEAPNPSFTLEEAFSPHSELAQLSNTKRTKLVRPTKETKMLPCYGAMDEKCTLGSSCAYSHDPAILMDTDC